MLKSSGFFFLFFEIQTYPPMALSVMRKSFQLPETNLSLILQVSLLWPWLSTALTISPRDMGIWMWVESSTLHPVDLNNSFICCLSLGDLSRVL